MTSMDITNGFHAPPVWQDLVGALTAGWQAFLRGRKQRRTVVAISRLGPRLIRDVGLDPEQIYETLEGSWDEVDPVALKILLPGDMRG